MEDYTAHYISTGLLLADEQESVQQLYCVVLWCNSTVISANQEEGSFRSAKGRTFRWGVSVGRENEGALCGCKLLQLQQSLSFLETNDKKR
jgi:hypothetical protein